MDSGEHSDSTLQPLYVIFGEESLLRRQALARIVHQVFGDSDASFGHTSLEGDRAEFASVRDELSTLPFLCPKRLLVIDQADGFVSKYRAELEKLLAEPPSTGVLVLDVKSWPSNTRLAKLLPAAALISCKPPQAFRVPDWCVAWAKSQHDKQMPKDAAALLVDLVGTDLGILDQEIAKLAVYVGDAKRIDSASVDAIVGRNREENIWRIFDAVGAGQAREAMVILTRLLDRGEEPLRILGAFSMQLRRLAQAARLHAQGESIDRALAQAGVPPFGLKPSQQLIQHLGKARVSKLYDWLLEVDHGMKGGSMLPARTLMEILLARLA